VTFTSKPRRSVEALAEYARLAVAGRLRVPVVRVLPLAEAADAAARSEASHPPGRFVLVP
jgi:NADPH:quinone reductase-like Zn-dependent oxidoreductase